MQTVEQLFPEQASSEPEQTAEANTLPVGHRRYRYFETKYRVERLLGISLLLPALPLIALCWCAVKITSRGPGIYRQTRVGHRGETFQVLKLRTMRVDAEANGPQWSAKGDSRITGLGKVFRKLHLDELPQLFNVARGEMVLVGPRPERPEFVQLLSEVIPGYQRRLIVKPGITGVAQINLPPDTDLRSVERKQILDLYHIDNAGLWMDERMIVLTAFRVLAISNDRLTNFMGLNRKDLVSHLPEDSSGGTSTPLSELMKQTTAKKTGQEELAQTNTEQPQNNTTEPQNNTTEPQNNTEEDDEAKEFHAAWDKDAESWEDNTHDSWEDDTHDSWEGTPMNEQAPT
jgi:lipopolysaccharide/colanic/teichoic acid biosynthesis glycosyltransferase